MQIERLRSLIRESVKDHIKEIEAVAEAAAMDARLAEYDKAIKTCEEKIQTAENLEEVKDLMDTGKLNELKKKLKDLKSKKEKLERQKAKKNKGKEVTTDAETDKMDEAAIEEGPGPWSQNNNDTDDMENMNVEETYTMDEMDMKDEALNESFLKMQKLAGVITEAQYNSKKKALVENENMTIADFLNANIEEFKQKIADPGSSFEIMGDEKVATAGDGENGIDVSFDKEHMLKLFPENDPYNQVEETEIAGRKVYYNNYL